LGGGKAVIIGDAKTQKTPELMRKFAEFVHGLKGKYITAEDVGMETADMDLVREVSPFVTGISEAKGGAGNPSPITACGVFMSMKSDFKYMYGSHASEDKVVCFIGIGHGREALVKNVALVRATVNIAGINVERLVEVSGKYGATIYRGADIFNKPMDVNA